MSHSQQYHFEIAIIDEDEIIDDIVSSLNIYDLRREIEQRLFPHSKYYSPLQSSIGWYLCFAVGKQKLIPLKTNDDLKSAVYEHRDKRNFKLLVKFKDEQKFKAWKEQQGLLTLNSITSDSPYTVSTPSIEHIAACPGYFKCTILYPSGIVNKIPYRIEYQTRRESKHKKSREQERRKAMASKADDAATDRTEPRSNSKHHYTKKSNVYSVETSPFIIRHEIWPNEKYQIRCRLVSKLFDDQRSNWTKWSDRHQVLPPSIQSLVEGVGGDQGLPSSPRLNANSTQSRSNPKGFSSGLSAEEFERFDAEQLAEWMASKLTAKSAIPGTPFERKQLFPAVLDVVQQTKLNGEQFLYQRPEQYIAALMAIYDTNGSASGNANGRGQEQETKTTDDAPSPTSATLHSLKSSQKRPPMPKSKSYSKYSGSTLDRRLDAKLQKIRSLIQQNAVTKSKLPQSGGSGGSADATVSDEDFVRLMADPEVQVLLSDHGHNAVEIGKQIEGKISRRRHGQKGAAWTKHDFLSILYRLKQCAFGELAFPMPPTPYCIYVWCFFIKEPSKQKYTVKPAHTEAQSHMLQKQDFHSMPLVPALSVGECGLYFGVYHLRTLAVWTDLEMNLYENGQIVILEGEQVAFRNQRGVHVVMRCHNTEKKGDRDDKIEKLRLLADWSNVYVKKNILRSTINLPFFDCAMKFVFRFVGQSVPFSDCVEMLNVLRRAHHSKYQHDLHQMVQDHMLQYKAKNRLFVVGRTWQSREGRKQYEAEKWLNLTAVLFRIYWIMGTPMTASSDLFDSRLPVNVDIIQQIVNGFYGPPMKVLTVDMTSHCGSSPLIPSPYPCTLHVG